MDLASDRGVDDMVREARRHFGAPAVLAAYDFMTLPVPRGGFPAVARVDGGTRRRLPP